MPSLIPNMFANVSGAQSASLLDQNFSAISNAINQFSLSNIYGVTANGLTDDAPAIQAAMNSLTNGGIVYLPFNSTILIKETLIVPDNVSLVGYNTTIKAGAAVSQMLNLDTHAGAAGNRYGVLAGIIFDGSNLATEGVYFGLAVEWMAYNVIVQNISPSGNSGTVGLGCAWVIDAAQNCTFINCGTNTACGVALLMINGAGGNTIIDFEAGFGSNYSCYLTVDSTRPGYQWHQFGVGAGPQENTLSGCRFEYGNASTTVLVDIGKLNTFYDPVFAGNGSGGPCIQFNSTASLNKLVKPYFSPGGGGRNVALINAGFLNTLEDPTIESFPTNSQVVKTSNKLVLKGFHQLSSSTYTYANTGGNVASNFVCNMPAAYVGSGTVASYTGLAVPGLFAFNDTGTVWVYDKTGWAQVGVPPENTLPIVGATSGVPFAVTLQLPAAGAYEIDVVAKNGDSNHGRHNIFSVLYSSAPSTNQPALCTAMLSSDQAWGSTVTALSASVSATGLLTINVTYNTNTNGSVNVAYSQVGYF